MFRLPYPHRAAASVPTRFRRKASYYDTEDNRVFGLRSSKHNPDAVDVGEFASIFGGGGHKHSSGFKVNRHHFLAKV